MGRAVRVRRPYQWVVQVRLRRMRRFFAIVARFHYQGDAMVACRALNRSPAATRHGLRYAYRKG